MKIIFIFLLVPFYLKGQQKEKWIDLPKEEWPQIALINQVQYLNGDSYVHPSFAYAGTGFLIDNGKEILAATAKHILWVAKNKQSKTVEVNKYLQRWTMKTKQPGTDSAVVNRLINEDSNEVLEGPASSILERDWIVFSVKSFTAGIQPLKIRSNPLTAGEKLYIISCAYADSAAKVYEGTFFKKLGTDILIDRDPKQHLPGSSGAPVIDANGFLVGIISSSSTDGVSGKPVSVAASVEYLLDVIAGKKNLNAAKKDYGKLVLAEVVKNGTAKAITLYKKLAADPANYYRYNLRSASRNGLLETGEELIKMKRYKNAVGILKLNVEVNKAFYLGYNRLAEARLLSGDKNGAVEAYKTSLEKYPDRKENEAYAELLKLGVDWIGDSR